MKMFLATAFLLALCPLTILGQENVVDFSRFGRSGRRSDGASRSLTLDLSFLIQDKMLPFARLASRLEQLEQGQKLPSPKCNQSNQCLVLFAPTDTAFRAFDRDYPQVSEAAWEQLLKYHLLLVQNRQGQQSDAAILTTLQGSTLGLEYSDKGIQAVRSESGRGQVIPQYPAMATNNGFIVPINSVLIPPGWQAK